MQYTWAIDARFVPMHKWSMIKHITHASRLLSLLVGPFLICHCSVPNAPTGQSLLEVSVSNPTVDKTGVCYWRSGGSCGTSGDTRKLDVYKPAGGGQGKGVLLYVHGGAWNGNTSSELNGRSLTTSGSHKAPKLFAQAGWRVLSMDYTSATGDGSHTNTIHGGFPSGTTNPGGGSPKTYEANGLYDVKVAIRYARQQYADPNGLTLIVMGHSAGGQLATLAALSANNESSSPFLKPAYPSHLSSVATKVDAVVNLAGPLDFEPWFTFTDFASLNGIAPNLGNDVAEFFGCRVPSTNYGGLAPCRCRGPNDGSLPSTVPACTNGQQPINPVVPKVSAATYADTQDPPIYVAYSEKDSLVLPRAGCLTAGTYYNLDRQYEFWVDVIEKSVSPTEHHVYGLNSQALITQFAEAVRGATFPVGNSPPAGEICGL